MYLPKRCSFIIVQFMRWTKPKRTFLARNAVFICFNNRDGKMKEGNYFKST